MKVTIVQFSSTPEQLLIRVGDASILVPWSVVKEKIPEIFSVENVYAFTYDSSMDMYFVQRRPSEPTIGGVEPNPELVWIRDNFDYLVEKLGPLTTSEDEHHYPPAMMHREWALVSTDWRILRHAEEKALNLETTLSEEQYTELLTFRQQLRDLPSTQDLSGLANDVQWPEKPSWLNFQGTYTYE